MTAPWILSFVALWTVVIFVAALQLGLMKRTISALEQAEGKLSGVPALNNQALQPGSRIPDVVLRDASGRRRDLRDWDDTPVIVLLLSQGCEPCDRLLEDLERVGWAEDRHPILAIVDEGWDRPVELPSGSLMLLFQHDESASAAFRTSATPQAFVTDGEGRVAATGIPNTVEDLVGLSEPVHRGVRGALRATG